MKKEKPYNPLDKHSLGVNVADALLSRSRIRLGDIEPFTGAGIYAIYYFGSYSPYRLFSEVRERDGREVPIYVGKAVPPGARKGNFDLDADPGPALYRRLKKHADSICHAENLEIGDFYCRYLILDDTWISLGESLLIARFSPLWNKIIDGFGNNDPGKGRYKQLRSRWDTLHPGRSWALKCKPRDESPEQIAKECESFLRNLLL